MGMEGEIGQIAPGRLADLVILEADPLADITHASRVFRVVKDGQPFDPDELMGGVR
jgi:imidazolonepropionase-like amidohydrolase